MFWGPEVIRRRSEATSSASALWSYLTSSGPKHLWQTYCAVSSYSVPHSRQARLVTAIRGTPFFVVFGCVTKKWLLPPHVSRNWHHPARMRRLPGFHRASPSTPLDVYSYVVGTIASGLE